MAVFVPWCETLGYALLTTGSSAAGSHQGSRRLGADRQQCHFPVIARGRFLPPVARSLPPSAPACISARGRDHADQTIPSVAETAHHGVVAHWGMTQGGGLQRSGVRSGGVPSGVLPPLGRTAQGLGPPAGTVRPSGDRADLPGARSWRATLTRCCGGGQPPGGRPPVSSTPLTAGGPPMAMTVPSPRALGPLRCGVPTAPGNPCRTGGLGLLGVCLPRR